MHGIDEEIATMTEDNQRLDLSDAVPAVTTADPLRLEAKSKVNAERQRKSDTDGRRRREKQIVANNQLV